MSDVQGLQTNTTHFFQRTMDMIRAGKESRKPSRLSSVVLGMFASLLPIGHFNWNYATFGEKLGISGGSMTSCIKTLEERGELEVSRNGRGNSNAYKLTNTVDFQKTAHIRTYWEFYTTEFEITVKKYRKIGKKTKGELLERRTVRRRLTPAEVDVLSFVLHETNLKGGFHGSIGEIAKELDMSERTVERAVYALFSAHLIFRPKKANAKGKSKFVANLKKIDEIIPHKESKKPQKSKKTSKKASHVQVLNDRADREKYYAALREHAQSRADKYMAQARADARFVAVTKELNGLELTLAKAELNAPATLPGLRARQKALQAEKAAILQRLGIDVQQLKPQWRCKACSDSGFLPNGQACDCYRRRE